VWLRAAICTLLAIAPAGPVGLAWADPAERSKLGFRATVDQQAKRLKKDGIPVEAIGPYRVGGVDVMRFVRTDRAGDWLAIHVWRTGGVTWISVVPRPLDEARSTE
jgi:hypothetical protein